MYVLKGVLLLLVLSLPMIACADEDAERNEVRMQTHDLLLKKDFLALQALHERYGTIEPRTSSGYPKLMSFFDAVVETPNGTREKVMRYLDERDAMTLQWVAENPESPFAVALHAQSLLKHGWFFRGTDYARNVASEDMAAFKKMAANAGSFLAQNRTVGARDAAWYAAYVDVARALAWSPDEVLRIANEALSKLPQDELVARNATHVFLPKWQGNAKMLDQYINKVALAAGPERGPELYSRLYMAAAPNQFGARLFEDSRIEWAKFKQGLESMHARYPTNWNTNVSAYHACMAGDAEMTRALIERIGDTPILSRWGLNAEQNFENCKSWRKPWYASGHIDPRWPTRWTKVMVIAGVGLGLLSLFMYSAGAARRYRKKIAKWDSAGMLEASDYEARRALFVVGPNGDEAHFYFELIDGKVLHLDGEDLHVIDSADAGDATRAYSNFPSNKFRIRKHMEHGHVVCMESLGAPIEQHLVESVSLETIEALGSLDDGGLIVGRGWDQILAGFIGHDANERYSFETRPLQDPLPWDRASVMRALEQQRSSLSLGVRILLALFAGLFGVVMVVIAPTASQPLSHYGFGVFCLSIAAGCLFSGRVAQFFWSLVGSVVFVAALFYLGDELWAGSLISSSPGDTSVLGAVMFFLVFGLTGATYAWRAKFGIVRDIDVAHRIDPNDPLMRDARDKAQASIDTMRALFTELPSDVAVKYPFKTQSGQRVEVWGQLLAWDDETMKVSLETPPSSNRGAVPESVKVPMRDIVDWHVVLVDGRIRGSYSAQAAIASLQKKGHAIPGYLVALEGRFVDNY